MTIDEIIKATEEQGTHSSVLVKNLAEAVKEGGGGGGVMLVELSYAEDATSFTANKTLAEVMEAYDNGVAVQFVLAYRDGDNFNVITPSSANALQEDASSGVELLFVITSLGSLRRTMSFTWSSSGGDVEHKEIDFDLLTHKINLSQDNTTITTDETTGLTKIAIAGGAGGVQYSRTFIAGNYDSKTIRIEPAFVTYEGEGSVFAFYTAYPVTAEMLNGAELINTNE